VFFRQIFDPKLAQYAYIVGCQQTGEALVIDPERDIDQYVRVVEEEDLTITVVAETHIHADFLSGARELAERFDVHLYLSDEGTDDWKYEWIKQGDYKYTLLEDGDTFRVGNIEVKAVHTPGHTPEHVSFLVTDRGGGASEPMGMATGDFIFVNDLGRPDLLESAAKIEGMMEPSARTLFTTVQGFLEMPDYIQIWPAHGAGSACGKALGAVPGTTVGYEKRFNPAIGAARKGEDAFVDYILEGQPEPPMYFARMKRDNKMGAPVLGDLPTPRRMTLREIDDLIDGEGSLIIDTRLSRPAFMARHLPGSLHCALNRSFNTAVGSLVEDETTPLYLVVAKEDVEEAVRDLVRIGYDNIRGFIDPETLERYFLEGGQQASIERIDFETMQARAQSSDTAVLDVRYASEHAEGHVPGSLNASYTRLPETYGDLPRDRTLLVHCSSGNRASSASSFLARLGFSVIYVDGSYSAWEREHGAKSAEPAGAGG
jgi:hydroxyacylglutathione hydrolase